MFFLFPCRQIKKSLFIRLSSFFIVAMALAIALYAVTYLMGSPFGLSKFVHVRKFSFLALKGVLAHSLFWKTAFTIHLIGGSVGLVLGCFLFFYKTKSALTHSITGTCYAAAMLFSSMAGFCLSYFASVSLAGVIGFFITDICWFASTWLGVRAIVRKDKLNHKKWFLRSFSFALIVASFRILFQVFFNVLKYDFNTSYVSGIWLSLLLNVIVAELIIRKKYAASVPTFLPESKQSMAFTLISEMPVTDYSILFRELKFKYRNTKNSKQVKP